MARQSGGGTSPHRYNCDLLVWYWRHWADRDADGYSLLNPYAAVIFSLSLLALITMSTLKKKWSVSHGASTWLKIIQVSFPGVASRHIIYDLTFSLVQSIELCTYVLQCNFVTNHEISFYTKLCNNLNSVPIYWHRS